jgi:hypothetical protein
MLSKVVHAAMADYHHRHARILLSACSPSKPAPSLAPALALWGDMKPVISVKELMRDMFDPASDNIFEAVKSEITKNNAAFLARGRRSG